MGREVGKVILERERERKRFGCGSCSGESGFWEREILLWIMHVVEKVIRGRERFGCGQ